MKNTFQLYRGVTKQESELAKFIRGTTLHVHESMKGLAESDRRLVIDMGTLALDLVEHGKAIERVRDDLNKRLDSVSLLCCAVFFCWIITIGVLLLVCLFHSFIF